MGTVSGTVLEQFGEQFGDSAGTVVERFGAKQFWNSFSGLSVPGFPGRQVPALALTISPAPHGGWFHGSILC